MIKARLIRFSKWFAGCLLGICLLITLLLYIFKDEICGYVVSQVNGYLKTEVTVQEVDLTFWSTFPYISVDFNGVFVRDAFKKTGTHDTLFVSDQIRMKFNPWDLWNERYNVKSLEIADGQLNLKVRKSGEVNYDIFKKSSNKSSHFHLKLEQMGMHGMNVSYVNKISGQQYHTKVDDLQLSGAFSDEKFTMEVTSAIHIREARSGEVVLVSNQPATCEMKVDMNMKDTLYSIPSAVVRVSDLPFHLNGWMNNDSLMFQLAAQNLELKDVVNKIRMHGLEDAQPYDGSGKVSFKLTLDGENKTDVPVNMRCSFGVENGSLVDPVQKLRISDIYLNGSYAKQSNKREELKVSAFRLRTPAGPFYGSFRVTEFTCPHIVGKAKGKLNMGFVHDLFRLPYFAKIKGYLRLDSDFDVRKEGSGVQLQKCEGEIELLGLHAQLEGDKRHFKDMRGTCYLRNNEAGIDRLSLNVGQTDLELDGVFRNLIAYIGGNGELGAEVHVRSRNIDVSDLGMTSKEEKIESPKSFVLPENIAAELTLDVGSFRYESHVFKKLISSLGIRNRRILFRDIQAHHAGCDMRGDVQIEERSPEYFYVQTNLVTDNMSFRELFREWNNFDQDVITEQNISGKAEAKVHLEAPFDFETGLISQKLSAQVYMKIKDGKLKDVGAFQSIIKSLDTKTARAIIGKENIRQLERKLKSLDFQTLENTFYIENEKLVIPEMLISSSVMDMQLAGNHTFTNKVDYRFAFRFRDLKEKKATEFGEEMDDGTGVRVYLRMTGDLDNPTIIWDRQAMKEDAKAKREEEKRNIKSMLKTEFGFFSKDSTVQEYQPKKQQSEHISIDFDQPQPAHINEEKRKPSKVKNKLNDWKKESEKQKQEEIEFD
jgi:hypothetical protein